MSIKALLETCCSTTAAPEPLDLRAMMDAFLKLKEERTIHCGPVTVEFTELACELVCYRLPRSRKRRVRNRWVKRLRNWRKEPTWYCDRPGHVYCHPALRPMLEKLFKEQ